MKTTINLLKKYVQYAKILTRYFGIKLHLRRYSI